MKRYFLASILLISHSAFSEDMVRVESLLAQGNAEIEKGKYEAAYHSCTQGIAGLGNTYLSQKVIDDTGQKLVLAEVSAKEGNYKVASAISCSSLSSRVFLHNSNNERGSDIKP
ncbi:hypothetical protein [uncultured Microbulbifer sp.]|uniref:hypothetical protein n=1 Tax=uncultured Microbulbifer sp. TaxID=348147 RepID=UPI00260805C2|nr:hypothetical protein [uncultured Microbulbifer sp.]